MERRSAEANSEGVWEVRRATTGMPAAWAEETPAGESSKARHWEGGMPVREAAREKMSGRVCRGGLLRQ